jgi:hypothetical protein
MQVREFWNCCDVEGGGGADGGEVLQCYELCNIIVNKEIIPDKVGNGCLEWRMTTQSGYHVQLSNV